MIKPTELTSPAMLKRLGAYARSMGIAADEMKGMRDPRLLLIVYKAMLYDEAIRSEHR